LQKKLGFFWRFTTVFVKDQAFPIFIGIGFPKFHFSLAILALKDNLILVFSDKCELMSMLGSNFSGFNKVHSRFSRIEEVKRLLRRKRSLKGCALRGWIEDQNRGQFELEHGRIQYIVGFWPRRTDERLSDSPVIFVWRSAFVAHVGGSIPLKNRKKFTPWFF
jgi:hypothetical protein